MPVIIEYSDIAKKIIDVDYSPYQYVYYRRYLIVCTRIMGPCNCSGKSKKILWGLGMGSPARTIWCFISRFNLYCSIEVSWVVQCIFGKNTLKHPHTTNSYSTIQVKTGEVKQQIFFA